MRHVQPLLIDTLLFLATYYFFFHMSQRSKELNKPQQAEIWQLRNIIKNLPISIYWKDKNGVYLGCNDYQAEMAGFATDADIIGKTDYDFPWKGYADEVGKIDQDIMQAGVSKELEQATILPSGKKAILFTHKAPLRDAQGKVIGIMGASIDITARKEAEVALQRAKEEVAAREKATKSDVKNIQQHLDSVIESIAGNHWWKDINGRYMGCNEAVAKFVGFNSSTALIGRTDHELPWISREFANELVKHDSEVIVTGLPLTYEETIPAVDGRALIFLVTKVPLKDENGNIIGTIGTSVDITEQKNAQIQLRIAKEKAEEASQAKSNFIANVSHDLRTPLSGILGAAELLKTRVAQSEQTIPHQIAQASKVLLSLFDEIIEYIEAEENSPPLKDEQFVIKNIAHDIVTLLTPSANQKKLKLKANLGPSIPPYLIGDTSRTYRILLNLVSNAIKFTHKGFVAIHITVAKKTDKNIILRVVIEDSGMGIPRNKLDQIFTRFTRLNPAQEGDFKGAGLGLSIVKQFIEEMSGEIYVESQLNKGSKFICILPFKKSLLDADVIQIEKNNSLLKNKKRQLRKDTFISAHQSLPAFLNNKNPFHVLLIEDDLLAQTVAKHNLEAFNCSVDIASSGREAISMFKKKQYHLILTDVGLPDISGYEITETIRKLETKTKNHVPIMAVTAYVDAKGKQRCIQAGMDEVLAKPLMRDVVRDVLEIHFKTEEIQKALSQANQKGKSEHLAIIDLDLGQKLINGNREAAKNLLKMLVEQLPNDKKMIEAAYKKNNYHELANLVHKLHSATCYCGTPRLKEVSAKAEKIIKSNNKKAIKAYYDYLIEQIMAVINVYKEFTLRPSR
jgi:two-component system aerobic respiration control sensor histidine kinase ArcB